MDDKLMLERLKERYRTLSEFWEPKSKHHTHIKISAELDRVIAEIKKVEQKLGITK